MTATTNETRWEESDVIARALRAYYRGTSAGEKRLLPFPSSYSWVEDHGGRDYAVLRNGNGPLGVWSVDRNGGLHRVERDRWPESLLAEG